MVFLEMGVVFFIGGGDLVFVRLGPARRLFSIARDPALTRKPLAGSREIPDARRIAVGGPIGRCRPRATDLNPLMKRALAPVLLGILMAWAGCC